MSNRADDVNKQSYLLIQSQSEQNKSSVHDTRAFWLETIRWLILWIVLIILGSFLLHQYFDEHRNISIHTDIFADTTSIDTPYFYFIAYSFSATNFSVDNILLHKQTPVNYNWKTFDASNYSYEQCCDEEWAVIYLPHSFQTLNTSQLLVIPPKKANGNTINRGDTLIIRTSVVDNNLKPTAYPGIFCIVDSIQDGIVKTLTHTNNNITSAIKYRFNHSSVLQHQFAPYNVYTMSLLQVTYEIDCWNEKWFGEANPTVMNTFYTADVKTSIQDFYVTNDSRQYNDFGYYINPTGAGTITNITKEKSQYLLDTFGKIGGYYGPLVSATSILLSIAIFGLPACCNHEPLFKGFASTRGLSNIQKQQIEQYLKKRAVTVVSNNKQGTNTNFVSVD